MDVEIKNCVSFQKFFERMEMNMNLKKTIAALAVSMMLTVTASAATTLSGTVHLAPTMGNAIAVNGGGLGSVSGVAWGIGGGSKHAVRQATLQLIAKDIDMQAIPQDQLDAWYHDGVAPEGQPIYITKADAQGKYSFGEIPQGSYYLLIIAPGQLNNWEKPMAQQKAEDKIENYLPNWDAFSLLTLGMNDYVIKEVDVLKGVPKTVDYDFNASPLKELSK